MERPDYIIKIDMIDTGTIETGMRLKQGDYGITMYLKISNNGNAYYDKNYIPEVYFRRPDGSTVIGKATEGHNDMYIYVIVGNELEIAGTVIMDIKFKLEGGRESSASCSFECVMDTLGKNIENSNIYWNDVTKIIEELNEKAKAAESLARNLSEIVSQTTANVNAAGESASLAQSYAVGGTGKRTGEDTDNAKYYKEQIERVAASVTNALKPWGTIQFSQLPQEADSGDMYNISDEFTTDEAFKDGAGITYPPGTNVYYTYDGYWDCLPGDLSKLQNHINEVQGVIGETDISRIGNGTVTGAVDELHKNMDSLFNRIYPVGSIYMSVSPTNPSALFGGTWVAWGAGRVPVGINAADADFKTIEKTGGAKTNTHYHFTPFSFDGSTLYLTPTSGGMPSSRVININNAGTIIPTRYTSVTAVRQDATFNQSISILPPYITCYMWKRTA